MSEKFAIIFLTKVQLKYDSIIIFLLLYIFLTHFYSFHTYNPQKLSDL